MMTWKGMAGHNMNKIESRRKALDKDKRSV